MVYFLTYYYNATGCIPSPLKLTRLQILDAYSHNKGTDFTQVYKNPLVETARVPSNRPTVLESERDKAVA
jgi:hypothetical protein